ncbi:unnamed protein product [Vitrella brassicaformis CCMP3155]|uniref:Uncharacterized protein n=1 Tax=Vitrella brassicaformis (strain CCMP3155) TaxID=1169540 RepID=A0A0G4ETM6_VITBC|nr:unnamed protein product [Vitrella brassicaformis CCMP3155]|mmetsp:Transcript_19735/g.47859  ORF Transcript_19735/g.47859 Transcript_19735/m.47859 type:complete len:94 (+) Transcript_19735:217-498(+)|eukprot:CEM01966.1 unnamed protein product [Vitrella brassicaformis CCMP3155]
MGIFLPALLLGGGLLGGQAYLKEYEQTLKDGHGTPAGQTPVFGFWTGLGVGLLFGLWFGATFRDPVLKVFNCLDYLLGAQSSDELDAEDNKGK